MVPKGPCAGCRWWRDGCALIRESRVGEILDGGPCRVWPWLKRLIDRFLRLHHGEAESRNEDLYQEIQLFLRQPGFRLPGDFVPDGPHLRSYLRTVVLNRASDFLRKERLVPKLRCGACLYRGNTGRCTRARSINGGGHERPHPHYDTVLDPGANPHSLKPPL